MTKEETTIKEDAEMTEMNLLDTDVDISEDGVFTINEKWMHTTVFSNPRNFITFVRNRERNRDGLKKSLSDEVIQKQEKDLKEMVENIEKLKPYVAEADKITAAKYQEDKKKGMIKRLQKELDKQMSDINLDYMNAVWKNVMQNEKDVMEALNDDQKQKFVKIKLRFMQKNRGKKWD